MPHKTYQGRTGVVFNVSRRAVGVEINKQVRNRIEKKRVNVRVEHVRPSKCRLDFLARVKKIEDLKRAAKKENRKVDETEIKRFPGMPKAGFKVSAVAGDSEPRVLAPQAFDEML